MMNNKRMTKAVAILLGTAAIVKVAYYEAKMPLLHHSLSGNNIRLRGGKQALYIPPSMFSPLDSSAQRRLSIDLGGGDCQWMPPEYDIPNNIDFFKTLIAGFPSCDKRMTFIQMEALTGWAAVDEWDMYRGYTNHPFIKSNYPHHEGIWSWGSQVDQVVMVVRNIRRTMVEYHDILWDIATAKNSNMTDVEVLYKYAPPISSFFNWRDSRVIDEISWYGWFIDYWMEGGLLRDIYTHQITTPQAWPLAPKGGNDDPSPSPQLNNSLVPTPQPTVSYDPQCTSGRISLGCTPVEVVSAEKLRDFTEGPAETARIANVLMKDSRISQYMISPAAWNCIWTELIQNGKGIRTVTSRNGWDEADYNFSGPMLQKMIDELDRLIDKYSSPSWNTQAIANRLVELLVEHRGLLQIELNDVNSGSRRLEERDFLGREERARLDTVEGRNLQEIDEAKDMEYFMALEKKMADMKRSEWQALYSANKNK